MAFQRLPTAYDRQQQTSAVKDRMAYILERVATMLECYPERADAPNNLTMAGAIAAILSEYPDEVVQMLTDPVRGLPIRLRFKPTPYEVKAACEDEMAPIRREHERRQRAEESLKLLDHLKPPKPTMEEIKAKLGPTYGLETAGQRKIREEPKLNLDDPDVIASFRQKFRDAVARSTFNTGREEEAA